MPIKNEYDTSLDHLIMKSLSDENKMSYRQLYRSISSERNRKLSFETYSTHIKKLKNDKVISLSKRQTGKKRFYSLTKIGRLVYGLNCINRETDRELYQKILEELFLCEIRKEEFLFYDEKHFLNFLKEVDIEEKELIWSTRPIDFGLNHDIIDFIYGPETISGTTFRKKNLREYLEKWKDFWQKEKNSFVLEDLDWICRPIIRKDNMIQIQKTEHWQINKDKIHYKYATTFRINLPGIYYNENSLEKKSYYIKIENDNKKRKVLSSDIKNIIDSFRKFELIDIIQLGNTKRLVISDPNLNKIIPEIMFLLEQRLNLLEVECLYKKPTKDEIKSIGYLIGFNVSKSMFQTLSFLRTEEMKLRNKIINSELSVDKTTLLLSDDTDYDKSFKIKFENSLIYKYCKELESILDSTSYDYVLNTMYLNDEGLRCFKMMPKLKIGEQSLSDFYFSILLKSENYCRYHVPKEVIKKEKRINSLKEKSKSSSKEELIKINRTIKEIEKQKTRLENFSDIPNFIKYIQETFQESYFKWVENVLGLRSVYNYLFIQYGYILEKLFKNIFPFLKKSTVNHLLELLDNPEDKIKIKKRFKDDVKKSKKHNKTMRNYYKGKIRPRIIVLE